MQTYIILNSPVNHIIQVDSGVITSTVLEQAVSNDEVGGRVTYCNLGGARRIDDIVLNNVGIAYSTRTTAVYGIGFCKSRIAVDVDRGVLGQASVHWPGR